MGFEFSSFIFCSICIAPESKPPLSKQTGLNCTEMLFKQLGIPFSWRGSRWEEGRVSFPLFVKTSKQTNKNTFTVLWSAINISSRVSASYPKIATNLSLYKPHLHVSFALTLSLLELIIYPPVGLLKTQLRTICSQKLSFTL